MGTDYYNRTQCLQSIAPTTRCGAVRVENVVVRPQTVVVIGAGISGLTAAYQLRRKLGGGARIVLVESAASIGGKLKTVATPNGPLEVGAEAYLAFRQDATDFFTELGLGDQLVEPSTLPSQLYIEGQLKALPRNTIMGIPAHAKGLEHLLSPETLGRIEQESDPEQVAAMHWTPGDDMNVGHMVAARLGEEVVDKTVSPLLGGVYSATAYDLGLRATIPQLAGALDSMAAIGEPVSITGAAQRVLAQRQQASQPRLASESAHETDRPAVGAATAPRPPVVFKTFRDGFEVLYERLLAESGAELLINTSAESLQRVGSFWQVGISNQESGDDSIEADGVVLAAPAHTAAKLLETTAKDAAELIGGIEASSSAVVALCFDTAAGLPEINGVLCETNADVAAKAFTVSSRKWPHIAQRYPAVVRASFGRFDDDSQVHRSDAELIAQARQDLAKVIGFNAVPVAEYVQRWWLGIPRLGVSHGQLIEFASGDVGESTGLGIAGAWISGPGIPECISNARAAATKVARDLL